MLKLYKRLQVKILELIEIFGNKILTQLFCKKVHFFQMKSNKYRTSFTDTCFLFIFSMNQYKYQRFAAINTEKLL